MSVIRPLDIRYPFSVATEPITLAEAKAWLQIDFSDWDTLLTNELIPAARMNLKKPLECFMLKEMWLLRTIN
jgi:hypothetical protein